MDITAISDPSKIRKCPIFFIGLTNFSENIFYYVIFVVEFDYGVYLGILGLFTSYFGYNLIFRYFLVNFLVPSTISRIWHKKISPNLYDGPMTDNYQF